MGSARGHGESVSAVAALATAVYCATAVQSWQLAEACKFDSVVVKCSLGVVVRVRA